MIKFVSLEDIMDMNELDNSTKRNIDSSVFILLECTTEGFEV